MMDHRSFLIHIRIDKMLESIISVTYFKCFFVIFNNWPSIILALLKIDSIIYVMLMEIFKYWYWY